MCCKSAMQAMFTMTLPRPSPVCIWCLHMITQRFPSFLFLYSLPPISVFIPACCHSCGDQRLTNIYLWQQLRYYFREQRSLSTICLLKTELNICCGDCWRGVCMSLQHHGQSHGFIRWPTVRTEMCVNSKPQSDWQLPLTNILTDPNISNNFVI